MDINKDLQHDDPLGTLVELQHVGDEDNGVRLFVIRYSRDCNGTPLYDLGLKSDLEYISRPHTILHCNVYSGYSRKDFVVVPKLQAPAALQTMTLEEAIDFLNQSPNS